MSAKTPTKVSDEEIAKILEKAPDGKADIPTEEPTPEPRTVSDLAYEVAFLAKDVAKQAGIPLGTAVTIVKTTLEYQLNRDALKLEIASRGLPPPGAKPIPFPVSDTEEENPS